MPWLRCPLPSRLEGGEDNSHAPPGPSSSLCFVSWVQNKVLMGKRELAEGEMDKSEWQTGSGRAGLGAGEGERAGGEGNGRREPAAAGQCTATECKAEAGLVSVSLGVAGLLWLVAVCEDVGLSEGGEFESKVGMGAGSAGSAGTAAGVGLMGTGIAGSVWPAAWHRGFNGTP